MKHNVKFKGKFYKGLRVHVTLEDKKGNLKKVIVSVDTSIDDTILSLSKAYPDYDIIIPSIFVWDYEEELDE